MSGVEVRRTHNTSIRVEVQAYGNRLTVDLLLWFAREAQRAVDAGLPITTEVKIEGSRISASSVLVEVIPDEAETVPEADGADQ